MANALPDQLRNEWRNLAPAWIKEAREGPNPTRTGLLDKPVLQACGKIQGVRAIDCGCGEGRFCRILIENGAEYVLGIDLCEQMVTAARQLQSNRDEYRLADAQDLSFLEPNSFDLAVSYLNQCDLPDFGTNTKEVFRILKPGSGFVVANLHPMRSAVGGWHRNDKGEKLHVMLDNYFDESARNWKMMGVNFTNFHRTLSTYCNTFIKAGFQINKIIEPTIDKVQLAELPQLHDELRVPNFIIFVLIKS